MGKLPIDEDTDGNLKGSNTEQFEDNVKNFCQEMLKQMYVIYENLRQTTIVDYLYDSVHEMATHLNRRLDSISKIYDEHPELKDDIGFDQTKDADYWALTDLKKVVSEFLRDYKIEYRVALSDMVRTYLERMDPYGDEEKGSEIKEGPFFPSYTEIDKKSLEIPEATMLPDKFYFCGKPKGGTEITAESKKVSSSIKLSIDPNSKNSYSANAGELSVDSSIQWMFDYDKAVEAGMAITVDVPNVTEFEYIYVYGVKSSEGKGLLENLFNGHNYFGSSLKLLDPRVSTNIVGDEEPVDDEEFEKRRRYEVEVNGEYLKAKSNDAEHISKILHLDYNNCFGHVYNFSLNRKEKTEKAYSLLWDSISDVRTKPKDSVFIRNFFVNHVRATGNIPSIKIGNLPYGFLPVAEYEKLLASLDPKSDIYSLFDFLLSLKCKWDELSKNNVSCISDQSGTDAENAYLEMAGQMPYSVSFIQRDEIQSPLIEGYKPKLSVSRKNNVNFDIVEGFLKKSISENPPVQKTDKLFDIKTSKLVSILTNNGFDENEAVEFVTEFIDLHTYRLDAWLNGVLDYIITNKIDKNSNGKYSIGAYGWVFNLVDKSSVAATNEDKDHFVLAPSLQHALSAAVLRSAYIKSKSCDTDSHICVNLSSMRARQALRLVDGIRSGMSMSVVLGCDLERYLHDAALHGETSKPVELDQFIYPLRQAFPQTVNVEAEDSRAEDYAMQVINGEALLETIINHEDWNWSCPVHEWLVKHFNDERLSWASEVGFKLNTDEANVFFNIVERLMDSYDALNDLLLSESVHRLVMGDQASFYAIGNFMAKGEGGLPDPEILKIPSEHAVVSHKAGLVLPQEATVSSKPFSMAEPGIDAWVEKLVGGMDKICFFVKRTINEELNIEPCSLKAINVSASEYLYLSAYPATFMNYLETRLRAKLGDYTSEMMILESGAEATVSCSSGQISLEEDALRIQTIRNILKKSHRMVPSDWISDIQSDKENDELVEKNELFDRFSALLTKAKALSSNLTHWLYQASVVDSVSGQLVFNGGFDDSKVALAYENLCECVEMGLVNCFTGFDSDAFADKFDMVLQFKEYEHSMQVQEDLFDMVQAADADLKKRIVECTVTKSSSVDEIIENIQVLTLKNVKIFPKFKLDSDLKVEEFVEKGLDNFDNVNEDSFDQWQDEVSEVREGMKDVYSLSMAQIALNKEPLNASILQTTNKLEGNAFSGTPKLSLLEGKWLGMPVKEESELRDVDSLVLYNSENYKPQRPNAGFIFDAWLEYIPYKKHNAGLVFHCDRPDAEAPQTMLIGVGATLDKNGIKGVLDATREMMVNRAVQPEHLYADPDLSHIFPLYSKEFAN